MKNEVKKSHNCKARHASFGEKKIYFGEKKNYCGERKIYCGERFDYFKRLLV